jgi:hypothetical protein
MGQCGYTAATVVLPLRTGCGTSCTECGLWLWGTLISSRTPLALREGCKRKLFGWWQWREQMCILNLTTQVLKNTPISSNFPGAFGNIKNRPRSKLQSDEVKTPNLPVIPKPWIATHWAASEKIWPGEAEKEVRDPGDPTKESQFFILSADSTVYTYYNMLRILGPPPEILD